MVPKEDVLIKMAGARPDLFFGKTAAAAGPDPRLVEGGLRLIATMIAPPALGYLGGTAQSAFMAPLESDLKRLQSQYVSMKVQQAVEELEGKKKLELAKEQIDGPAATLRF